MLEPKHQAFLLAFLIRAMLNRIDKDEGNVISEAVQTYGQRRGKRMSKAAYEDGFSNNLMGYLLYGEIDFSETGNEFKIEKRKPYFKVIAKKCFWHDIWEKHAMLDVGEIYCRDIDKAIVQGFNSNVKFDVPCNMNNGYPVCEFNYFDWKLGLMDLLKYLVLRKKIKKKALKSWDFHCADVLHSFSYIILKHFGDDGKIVIDSALSKFSEKFGKEVTDYIKKSADSTAF